ncbi:hypothetical protein C0216_12450 [Streptomyces globosus]|uniref:DUF6777 domain-containing protein n=1 Tax=Streptomyces globosus TaxID=68209 RepID=A0A344TZT8_9ACTN|nr:DUF6777 domain-containing protein [Streptomyces globosus]AXE24159.1 hypothetical protein C0216_12450 [Streptomyces globosus]
MTLLGLAAAACGGGEEPPAPAGPENQEIHLQPVGSAGPDPFTPSSATAESAPAQPPLPNPTGRGIRTVGGATPGLYGGTKRLGSCDVEQQLRALTGDDNKARAFAAASSVQESGLPEFLRGLTPVVLRADTRVTNHGFRDGGAYGFQAVLQAGTAVLVDAQGMPRLRCAGGSPLLPPLSAKGTPAVKGERWNGYQPNQVIVIEPTAHPLAGLVIANVADNTWIERTTGDDGAQDRSPRAMPAYDPADGIPVGAAPASAPAAPPAPPGTPGRPPGESVPGGQDAPQRTTPSQPGLPADGSAEWPADGSAGADPAAGDAGDLAPWPGGDDAAADGGDLYDPNAPDAEADAALTDPGADPWTADTYGTQTGGADSYPSDAYSADSADSYSTDSYGADSYSTGADGAGIHETDSLDGAAGAPGAAAVPGAAGVPAAGAATAAVPAADPGGA